MTFLSLSHPQSYLRMLLHMQESINSYKYDEQMLYFLSELSEMYTNPGVNNPRKLSQIPDIREGNKTQLVH